MGLLDAVAVLVVAYILFAVIFHVTQTKIFRVARKEILKRHAKGKN
jgi:hypothetical protein